MGFCSYYQYPPTYQKLSKSHNSLKIYEQIKCAISETVDLLHAYLHLPRTTFGWGYLIVEALDYRFILVLTAKTIFLSCWAGQELFTMCCWCASCLKAFVYFIFHLYFSFSSQPALRAKENVWKFAGPEGNYFAVVSF